MKKLLISLCALIMFAFVACAHGPAFDHSTVKDDIYLDPSYLWMNSTPNNAVPSLRAITLRVINKKYRDVDVKVKCIFIDDGVLFGTKVQFVKARNDAVFTVKGFSRAPFKERIRCTIRSYR